MNSGELASKLHETYEAVAEKALCQFFPGMTVIHHGRGYAGGGSDYLVKHEKGVIPIEVKGVKMFRRNGRKTQLGMLKLRAKDVMNWNGSSGFVIVVIDQDGLAPSYLCLKVPAEQFFLRYPRGKENTTKEGIWHVRLSGLQDLAEDFIFLPKEDSE